MTTTDPIGSPPWLRTCSRPDRAAYDAACLQLDVLARERQPEMLAAALAARPELLAGLARLVLLVLGQPAVLEHLEEIIARTLAEQLPGLLRAIRERGS
jgi:hypothetical protein